MMPVTECLLLTARMNDGIINFLRGEPPYAEGRTQHCFYC